MAWWRSHLTLALTCVMCGCLGAGVLVYGSETVIDLTHTYGKDVLSWPGNPAFTFTVLSKGYIEGTNIWLESNAFSTPEHAGTHLDAPAHFGQTSWTVDEIPAHRLVGPGVVVDVADKVKNNPDYLLGVSDLEAWERDHGEIPKGAFVLMNSGWSSRYPNKSLTFNTDDVTDSSTFHFPGFHPEAADWMIQNRDVSMIGVDTPSTDFGQSTTFEVHVKISAVNIAGLENLNNVGKLPPRGITVFVGAVKLEGGSGCPVRVIAVVGDGQGGNGASPSSVNYGLLALLATLCAGIDW